MVRDDCHVCACPVCLTTLSLLLLQAEEAEVIRE